MDEKPKELREVVWTGKSDRKIRDDPEVYHPRKVAKGRAVYELGEGDAAMRAKTLYPERAKAPPPKPAAPAAAPPVKPAAARPKIETSARSAAARPTASPPVRPAAPKPATATPATSREQSRVIAQTVVGSFVDRMKAEAKRKGGSLTLKDIESLDQEFAQKTQALEVLFEKTFREYARSFAKQSSEERRQHPFDRLIVSSIERILAGGKGPPIAKGGISRRILPGFFMAVNMMMGPDVMAEYRLKASSIFERVNGSGVNGADWFRFTSDPEARTLRLDALVDMAVHFANPEKRAAWFIAMVNDHMAPPETDPQSDPDWTLGKPAYDRMIDSMFADLMAAINDAKAREGITKRFGPETCASVTAIMKGLGA